VVNKDGRILINKIEEKGWAILNGSFGKEGGWTYIGEVGSSIIDYVRNNRAIEEIRMVEEGNKTDSNHIPLKVEIAGPKTSKKSGKKTVIEIERSDWTEKRAKSYQENCSGWSCTQTETEGIWKEIRKKVKGSIIKQRKKIIPWRLGKRE